MNKTIRTAYFDCAAGISGDMILAACISAGVPARELERILTRRLKVKGWTLEAKTTRRYHFPAVSVRITGDRHFDSPSQMRGIITRSTLPPEVRKHSLAVMDTLIHAEAKVHRVRPAGVHFHELNSIDTLIDITGASTALSLLGISRVYASPLNIGCAAPATMAIVTGSKTPVYTDGGRHERTTPTGAAIITRTAVSFGPMPVMPVDRSGWGAGTLVTESAPNVLRLLMGRAAADQVPLSGEDAVMLETNIDDMDPRVYPGLVERLLALGAHDAWLTQILMKKGRPGILLSALCSPDREDILQALIFEETTTLGVRRYPASRTVLARRQEGAFKRSWKPSGESRARVEFEAARRVAARAGIPVHKLLD